MGKFLPAILFAIAIACASEADRKTEIATIRQLEHFRLRALVDADMTTAQHLHADDFQLITPDGSVFSKQEYLGQIESGALDYQVWEPREITVRLYDDVAAARYQDARFEVYVNGQPARVGTLRHTNLYEKRDGQWQVVWSHASGGQPR